MSKGNAMSLLQTGISLLMEPKAVSGLAATSWWLLVCSLAMTSASKILLCSMQSPRFLRARLFLGFGKGFWPFIFLFFEK